MSEAAPTSRGQDAEPAPCSVIYTVAEPGRRRFLEQTWRERLKGLLWAAVRHTVFRWSLPSLRGWRNLLLRSFGATIGRGVYVDPSVRVDFPWHLELGDRVFIAHESILNCMGRVRIGARSRLSQYAHICAGSHRHDRRDMHIVRCPITIGEDVWIAADAFVGPNVTIGDNCVLAARSSAFSDLPAGFICVGEPAEPVRRRDAEGDG